MKVLDKYWRVIKKNSPTILSILGSAGVGVTAYLSAKNEAAYQHKRFDYYREHGMFPEELSDKDLSKDEIRSKGYRILGNHLKQHITTFVSGGLTITSILGGNAAGKKQNAALLAMNVGVGNMMAKRKEAETKVIEMKKISREDIQDYLIREAYMNHLLYYTSLAINEDEEEFVWLDIYPSNKIFILRRNDVNGLPWFINNALKEENHVSYGEIFDYLNIDYRVPSDFIDQDINDWIYLYGFSKDEDTELKIDVYSRRVEVEEGVFVTALSFSTVGNAIQM